MDTLSIEDNKVDENMLELPVSTSLSNKLSTCSNTDNSSNLENYKEEIDKLNSVPIIDSIDEEKILTFQHYNLRYYEDRYCISFNTDTLNSDVLLRFHTNGLILISIARGHDIFRKSLKIEKLNFYVNNKNLLDIQVSGKKKFGAHRLSPNSQVCLITCKKIATEYPLVACVTSNLIEINQHVVADPSLLKTAYKGLGYIAILYPTLYNKNNKFNLLDETAYQTYLSTREFL